MLTESNAQVSKPNVPRGFPGVAAASKAEEPEALMGIEDVQKVLDRSRASVHRYTNTDPRNPFNPRKLNPVYRADQKDPLQFHPDEVARFARDILHIKFVDPVVINSSQSTQKALDEDEYTNELYKIFAGLLELDTSINEMNVIINYEKQVTKALLADIRKIAS